MAKAGETAAPHAGGQTQITSACGAHSRVTEQMRPVACDCCLPMLMVLLNMLGLLMPGGRRARNHGWVVGGVGGACCWRCNHLGLLSTPQGPTTQRKSSLLPHSLLSQPCLDPPLTQLELQLPSDLSQPIAGHLGKSATW